MSRKASYSVATLPYVQMLQVREECPPPEELLPLLDFIQELVVATMHIGIGFAAVPLGYAGIQYMWGGPEGKQKAKKTVQGVIVGLVIILSAPYIVDWIAAGISPCRVET